MGGSRTRASVHQRIIKIVDDLICLLADIPELQGREEFPGDIKKIIISQSIIKFQFINPLPLIEMKGNLCPLLFKIGKVLKHPIPTAVDLQAMDQESDLHSLTFSGHQENGFGKIDSKKMEKGRKQADPEKKP